MKTDQEIRETDQLVRAALNFLTHLFPVANVHIAYDEMEHIKRRSGTPAVGDDSGSNPLLHWDIRQVPTRPDYCRVVGFNLDREVSRFLEEEAEYKLKHAYRRLSIPVRVAHRWTEQISEGTIPDITDALLSELPTHIIARLMADRYARLTGNGQFSFAHYQQGGPHDHLSKTIVRTIGYMNDLGSSRVERESVSHAVVIAPMSEGEEYYPLGTYPDDLQGLQRSPLLADGYRTVLRVSPDGELLKLLTENQLENRFDFPGYDFGSLAFAARTSKGLGGMVIMLQPEGSIVTFAEGRPLFIRRRGTWRGMLWDSIRGIMADRYGSLGVKVFNVALIQATSGKGSLLGIIDEVPQGVSKKDRVDMARELLTADHQNKPAEWIFHNLLPTEKVGDLSADTLSRLASIDGATLVDREGRLITYGAIVPSEQTRSEGARSAAARSISRYGLVIKVSEDGPIQIYEDRNLILEV